MVGRNSSNGGLNNPAIIPLGGAVLAPPFFCGEPTGKGALLGKCQNKRISNVWAPLLANLHLCFALDLQLARGHILILNAGKLLYQSIIIRYFAITPLEPLPCQPK